MQYYSQRYASFGASKYGWTPLNLYFLKSISERRPTVNPTHRAVRSHPVGVTAAKPSVRYEGPVTMALVWALSPGQLTVEPSPAWLTVALPIHADAIIGACWIQAIHCNKPEKRQYEKNKNTNKIQTNKEKS